MHAGRQHGLHLCHDAGGAGRRQRHLEHGRERVRAREHSQLGSWNTSAAIALSGGPTTWRTTVQLPESVHIELKFIRKNAAGHVTYELGANRTFEVPVAPSATLSGTFR